MKKAWAIASLLLVLPAAAVSSGDPAPSETRPAMGLAIEFEKAPAPEIERRALAKVRGTGVSLFALKLSWSAAEPEPGRYRVEEITRTARILRQSGALLHLDLSLIAGRSRDVPRDLAAAAFDDPRLSIRLGRLLNALEPALADFATLSFGYEAEAYFADKPVELEAFRRLFLGALDFLHKLSPELSVGITTAAPTESVAPEVAARLHQKCPVLFYIYAPFEPKQAYLHRSPDALERDWKRLIESSGGRPIAFTEVSYSSSPVNGSSPEKQAAFVAGLRRFLASHDGKKLLFARYVGWRDPPPDLYRAEEGATETARRRAAFLANRGLQTADGVPKPAWKMWVKAGR